MMIAKSSFSASIGTIAHYEKAATRDSVEVGIVAQFWGLRFPHDKISLASIDVLRSRILEEEHRQLLIDSQARNCKLILSFAVSSNCLLILRIRKGKQSRSILNKAFALEFYCRVNFTGLNR